MLVRAMLATLVVLFCSTIQLHAATPEQIEEAIRKRTLEGPFEGSWCIISTVDDTPLGGDATGVTLYA